MQDGFSPVVLESTERGGVAVVVLTGPDARSATCPGALLGDDLNELHRSVVAHLSGDQVTRLLLVPVNGVGQEVTGVRWDAGDQLYYPEAGVSQGTPAALTVDELQQLTGVPVSLVEASAYLTTYHRLRPAGPATGERGSVGGDVSLAADLEVLRDEGRRDEWAAQYAGTVRGMKVLVELAYLGELAGAGTAVEPLIEAGILDLMVTADLLEQSGAGLVADRLRRVCGLTPVG